MKGRRLSDVVNVQDIPCLLPGDYIKVIDVGKGNSIFWLCCSPNNLMGNLGNHTVQENNDGTITVSPSIKITGYDNQEWHGYLKQGIWESC